MREQGNERRRCVAQQGSCQNWGVQTLTRHRGEVDADQQREEAGDVGQHVAVGVGQGVVGVLGRVNVGFGNQVPLLVVGPEQVLCTRGRIK